MSRPGEQTGVPWYVRAVTMVGAWLASSLLLGFLFVAELITLDHGCLPLGIVLMVASLALSWLAPGRLLADPLVVAFALLGQLLFAVGMAHDAPGFKALFAAGCAVEGLFLVLTRSATLRFMSVVLLFGSLLGLIWNTAWFEATHLLVGAAGAGLVGCFAARDHAQWARGRLSAYIAPTAYGLAVSLFGLTLLCVHNRWFEVPIALWWLSTALLFACLAAVVWPALVRGAGVRPHVGATVVAGLALLLAPTLHTPGVMGGVLVLVTGFAHRARPLMALGVAFFAVFIAAWYYSLQVNLLTKSYILLATGTLLLAGCWLVRKVARLGATT